MRTRILVVIALVALGATVCGSSSKTADAPSGTTTPGGSDSPAVTTTTAASSDGDGGGGGDFCELLKKEANAFDAEDLLTSKSAEEIKDIYANVEAKLDDTVSKAPDEIKSDLSTLNESIKTLVDVLEKANYDFTKLSPDSFKGLDDPKFETASTNIEKYLTDTCHVTSTT